MEYHKELKDHIRAKKKREGKRSPVGGLEASKVAAEYLELKPIKVTRK